MSKIVGIIGPDSFELVRDRIGEILVDEIANQYALTSDEDLNLKVVSERFIPFDKIEVPVIDIQMAGGPYDQKTVRSSRGTINYFVDVYCKSKNTDSAKGDKLSRLKVHKLLRVCRNILRSPHYITLGFDSSKADERFINGCMVKSINVAEQDNQEATHLSMGRLVFEVIMNESVEAIQPTPAAGYSTQVNMSETDYGYEYILNN